MVTSGKSDEKLRLLATAIKLLPCAADIKTHRTLRGFHKITWLLGHTSKPGPDSDSDLDSDPKKIRTREKPGLVLGLAFKKPGLDNRKPGLQIENTGFDETGF